MVGYAKNGRNALAAVIRRNAMSLFKSLKNQQPLIILAALGTGILLGNLGVDAINESALVVATVFVNLLKMLSLPLVFLTIVSTLSGMKDWYEVKKIGGNILKYTLLTTILAALCALILYILINPLGQIEKTQILPNSSISEMSQDKKSYGTYLLSAIPNNFLGPFISENVLGILLLALMMSLAILQLPHDHKETCNKLFNALAAVFLKIAEMLILFIPVAVCAFTIRLWEDFRSDINIDSILLYIVCIICANLFQALIVLPILLKLKGISPFNLFKNVNHALTMGFFSKSSAATLPLTISCAEEKVGIDPKIARIALPMCTTINMNACAAFILITYLFVSGYNGYVFTLGEQIGWILIATIAAIGNAAVPMGCFFLTSAFLAASDVPLSLMGIILPVYTLIDMLETAINVWSDICVTAIVNKENPLLESNQVASDKVAIETFSQSLK